MELFQPLWKLNISSSEQKDAFVIVMRPGSEILLTEKSVLPYIQGGNYQEFSWPCWGIGKLYDRLVVVKAAPESAAAPAGMEWQSLRLFLANMNSAEIEALCRAAVIVNWDVSHRYCGSCGIMTILDHEELARVCPSCSFRYYPRISPSMIVRITNGQRILLAHNKRFAPNVYSCVAGYAEPGETLERTVIREIKEETGLDIVGDPQYIASQSWPFPNSLMMAFSVTAKGEPVPDGVEITDVRWFEADALPLLPRPGTIAHTLISTWLKETGK